PTALQSFFLYCSAHHRTLHSFPTRRSSDLPTPCPLHGPPGGGSREDHPVGDGKSDHAAAGGGGLSSSGIECCAHCGTERSPSRRSEEHTSELQSRFDLVCRLLLEKKK